MIYVIYPVKVLNATEINSSIGGDTFRSWHGPRLGTVAGERSPVKIRQVNTYISKQIFQFIYVYSNSIYERKEK